VATTIPPPGVAYMEFTEAVTLSASRDEVVDLPLETYLSDAGEADRVTRR